MNAVPLSQREANDYIANNHRHHDPVRGDKFRVGCEVDGKICGVACVGRPVSRHLDDGTTLEVLRLCTDGTKNACSFLYSRCARIAREMGYKRIVTYILETESGDSLKASGWSLDKADCGGGSWSRESRPRVEGIVVQANLFGERVVKKQAPTCKKQRWIKIL